MDAHTSFRHAKLRRDLAVSRQGTPDGAVFVIKDPATGRFFRFKEPEYFIAQHLDGETPFDVIQQRGEEKFGASLSRETLDQFIEKLRRLGLLEAEGAEHGHSAPKRGRVRGSLFYLRFKAFDPDRLFDRLIGKVRIFFTTHFVALSALLILLALIVTISNSAEIGQDLFRLYHVNALILAWTITIFATIAHEFAHGLTCKRFGGKVNEMGFMLIFFMPAMYCNVSDAWLFPQKSKRLWVTFAGAYFELFLWAVAVLIWRVVAQGTWLSFVALVVVGLSSIRLFFNLNPLIKLDGYYLLSDFLDIPNLRSRAVGYVSAGIKRLFGSSVQIRETTPRERRIYIVYGLLSLAYTIFILSFIAMRFGGFLMGQYQAFGFILFMVLVMIMLRNPIKRMLLKPLSLFTSMGSKLPPVKKPIKVTAILAVLLAVLFFGWMELKVAGKFEVFPIHNDDVRAQVDGIIKEIAVDEGDQVKKGQLLALLSDREYRAELRKIEAEIVEKQAKLKMLRAGARREEIELSRQEVSTAETRQQHARNRYQEAKRMHEKRLSKSKTTVEKAKERFKYARSYFTMHKELFEKDLISRRDFEKTKEEWDVRGKELEEAQAELKIVLADDLGEVREAQAVAGKELGESEGRLKVLLAGSRPEEIEATEAEMTRLEAQRRHLREQIELARVLSPSSGVITTPKLKEKIGQHVEKGDLIAEVGEGNRRCEIGEQGCPQGQGLPREKFLRKGDLDRPFGNQGRPGVEREDG
jgi:multidrug resistance efflux pump